MGHVAEVLAVGLLGACCGALAQGDGAPGQSALNRSFYDGQTISSPEALSGLWEAPDGDGGAVGIHLILIATGSYAKGLAPTPELRWKHLEVAVYERKGQEFRFGDQSFFGDSPREGGATLADGHLRLHFTPPLPRVPIDQIPPELRNKPVDLDLVRDGDTWVGRLHRGDFDSAITLRRPGAEVAQPDAVTGTWLDESDVFSSCVHITGAPYELFGWADRPPVAAKGAIVPPPLEVDYIYGALAEVKRKADDTLSLTFDIDNIDSPALPHEFDGKLSDDGASLVGGWPAGPNQAPRPDAWKRVEGDSCAVGKPKQVEEPRE